MGKRPPVEPESKTNPLAGLREYLEIHQKDSIIDRENGKDTSWALFLHKGVQTCGMIRENDTYEFKLLLGDGTLEETHKVNVKFICPDSFEGEVLKQMKRSEAKAGKPEGPHFIPRYRHHIKNKSLYPLMNRREVLFFTTVEGEILRGVVSGFSRFEICLTMRRGVPVTIMRHAVYDVRDKKGRSYLKKVVEKTGQYW